MSYDYAPIKNTCPQIDSIIGRMEQVLYEAEDLKEQVENQ
jgi:hypothetical protein